MVCRFLCGRKLLIFLVNSPGTGLLESSSRVCSRLYEISKLSFKVTFPICIPQKWVSSPFVHVHVSVPDYGLSVGVQCYLLVLIWGPRWMANSNEHLFIYLFVSIHRFGEVSRLWVHLKNRLPVFLLISFEISILCFGESALSAVSFAGFFFQSVACLLIFLTLSFTEPKFSFFKKI